jgi:DeoR family transcriptional regulator, suf operon transcriptional repressor
MKSTREKILRTLLSQPESSINDLAKAVGINGISIRHHLTILESENLIFSTEERHGVGRPRLIYSLTKQGAEQFPTSYLRLTRRLISALKHSLREEQLKDIFQLLGEQLAEKYDDGHKQDSFGARLDFVKQVLSNEGFIIELEEFEKIFQLRFLSCPYYNVGLEHPEVCIIDHALIASFFPEPVTIKACILKGDPHCLYEIRP